LQPDNSRQAKPIGDNVYLMNHVDCPAVLVECGFLSNPEEEAMLRQEGYQTKLAAVLAQVCLAS
jgi:N-acetylmuramoyl-L-alanine amidase